VIPPITTDVTVAWSVRLYVGLCMSSVTLVHPAKVEVGRVANFAGYRIRVPGRYYPAGSGPDPGISYVTCNISFVWYPSAASF